MYQCAQNVVGQVVVPGQEEIPSSALRRHRNNGPKSLRIHDAAEPDADLALAAMSDRTMHEGNLARTIELTFESGVPPSTGDVPLDAMAA